MKKVTMYVTTKVVIECPEHMDPLEVIEEVSEEMDYSFSYDDSDTETTIVNTEILEVSDAH